MALEFVEVEGSVVEGGGEAEAVVDEGLFAAAVAAGHAAHLGHGHVAFVDEEQPVVGEVVEQGPGGGAGGAAGEVAGVVLNAGAVADLAQGFEVVAGALLQAGGLQDAALGAKLAEALVELDFDVAHGRLETFLGGDEVLGGVDVNAVALGKELAGERVQFDDALDAIVEELDADGELVVGGVNGEGVATDAEATADQVHFVAVVLQVDEAAQDLVAGQSLAFGHREHHGLVLLRARRDRRCRRRRRR